MRPEAVAPRRILIVRDDNIGDCVLFSGALKWIRDRWPSSRVSLMVQPHVRNLFQLCPYLDAVLSTDQLYPWELLQRLRVRGAWRGEGWMRRVIPRVAYSRYDLVLCPVSSPREDLLAAVRSLRAPEKWGYGGYMLRIARFEDDRNRPERVFTRTYACTQERRWEHEFGRLRGFLGMCGIALSNRDVEPEFWLSEEDHAFADAVMPSGPVLGIFPGAASKWRWWPRERWGELLRSQTLASRVVIFGSGADREQARGIQAAAAGQCAFTDLTGKTALRQLVACAERCTWMVSTESAGLHIAVACGVPAVGIVGGHHFGRYYPWGDDARHRAAHLEVPCSDACTGDCVRGDFRCVKDIPSEVVVRELSRLPRPAEER